MKRNELTDKMMNLSTEEVAEIAATTNADMSDAAGLVLEAALEVLEQKMESSDYIRFCDKLAA